MTPEILPPLSASVHVKPAGWRFGLRLWLPLFLLWLLLIPLLILALPATRCERRPGGHARRAGGSG
jgi:uncharacterized protein (DUF58 family)